MLNVALLSHCIQLLYNLLYDERLCYVQEGYYTGLIMVHDTARTSPKDPSDPFQRPGEAVPVRLKRPKGS